MIETFETFNLVQYCSLLRVQSCSSLFYFELLLNHHEPLLNHFLANALAVATIAGIYTDSLAFVYEERYADLSTCLESSRFEGVGSGIALETWLGVGDYQLNLGWQLSEEDSVGACIRYNIANKTLFQELNTCDKVVTDRYLLESLLVHEDIILTLFVEELVWTALNANILKFLTNVEAALQYATINNIFEFNTHDGVTLSWLNVQEVNYKIQTAVHADTYAVLYVLRVNHKSYKLV